MAPTFWDLLRDAPEFLGPHTLLFLTNWFIIMVILAPLIYRGINLCLLACVVAAGGWYITYVRPRVVWAVKRNGERVRVEGQTLKAFDLLLHVLPTVFVFWRYWGFYARNPWGMHAAYAVLAMSLYATVVDPMRLYGLDGFSLGLVLAGGFLAYAIATLK